MFAVLSGVPPSRLHAQTRSAQAGAQAMNAEQARDQIREILVDYPPSLGQVLRLDPSLLNNATFLEPYPALATFVKQHPEVAHTPVYFFGDARIGQPDNDRLRMVQEMQAFAAGTGIFFFFMAAFTVITHIARSVLEHRRWQHATKVQTEAHTKIVDRLASNEDLIAYIQSPAGQRFLSAAPAALEPQMRSFAAPAGRILGSLQIGTVLACGGLGLWFANGRIYDTVFAQPLHVIAIVTVAIGVGFALSGVLSYELSRRLGLLNWAKPDVHA
jgi:hypothetical protein